MKICRKLIIDDTIIAYAVGDKPLEKGYTEMRKDQCPQCYGTNIRNTAKGVYKCMICGYTQYTYDFFVHKHKKEKAMKRTIEVIVKGDKENKVDALYGLIVHAEKDDLRKVFSMMSANAIKGLVQTLHGHIYNKYVT